jgi:hypothetical protein
MKEKAFSLDQIPKLIQQLSPNEAKHVWRNRDGNQIFSDGSSTGCTDNALVFSSLARSLGIPTIYVETLQKRWLDSLGKEIPRTIEGHVFCDVILDDKIIPFDPMYGKTEVKHGYYIEEPRGERIEYDVLGKGSDFSEVYLKIDGKFETTPTRIQTIEDLREAITKKYIK